jgi:hypothetical protein
MTPWSGAKSRRAPTPASRSGAEKFSGGRKPAARSTSHRAADRYIKKYINPPIITTMIPNQIMSSLILPWAWVAMELFLHWPNET